MARFRLRPLFAFVALLALALGAHGLRSGRSFPAVLVVIINPRNPVADLSMNELRAYFRLERSWPGNLPAKLWLRSSELEDNILLDRVYKWDRQERRRYFRDRENRGEIKAPAFTPTAAGAGRGWPARKAPSRS